MKPFTPEQIEAPTALMMQNGIYFFHVHRFAHDDVAHSMRLFKWADVPKGSRILDIGCGVGAMAISWSAFDETLKFSCLNISEYQLSLVPAEFDRIHGDMHKMPLDDGTFDAAICCFTIGHGDHRKVFEEVARVLKDGGIFFLYDMIPEDGDYTRLHDLSYSLLPKQEIEDLARSAGFDLDFYMEPQDNGYLFEKLPVARPVFSQMRPAIWRFEKREHGRN